MERELFAIINPALFGRVGFHKPVLQRADVTIAIEWLGVVEHLTRVGEDDLPFDEVMRRLQEKGVALFRLVEPDSPEATESEPVSVWIQPNVLPDLGSTALMHARVIFYQYAVITYDAGSSDESALAGRTAYRLVPVTSSPVAVEEVALA